MLTSFVAERKINVNNIIVIKSSVSSNMYTHECTQFPVEGTYIKRTKIYFSLTFLNLKKNITGQWQKSGQVILH